MQSLLFQTILPINPNPDRIPGMKIRSITFFLDPSYPLKEQKLKVAGEFLKIAQPAFIDAGYEVQTARMAIVPFPRLLTPLYEDALPRLAQKLEAAAAELGFAYVSLGPALPELPQSYGLIPEALAATQNAFFSGLMTTPYGKVSLNAIHQCGEVIQRASSISPDGFANLRFAALANVPAGSHFSPAAYHQAEAPS